MKKLFFVFLVFFLIGSSFCYAFGFKVVESIEGEAYYNKKKSKKISEKVLPRNDEKKLKMFTIQSLVTWLNVLQAVL